MIRVISHADQALKTCAKINKVIRLSLALELFIEFDVYQLFFFTFWQYVKLRVLARELTVFVF